MKSRLEAVRAALTAAGQQEPKTSALATTYDLTQGPPALREFYAQMLDDQLPLIYSEGWPTDAESIGDGAGFKEEWPGGGAGVFRIGNTVALAALELGELHLKIAANSRDDIGEAVTVFRARFPFAVMPQDDLVPVTFWSYGRFGAQSYTRRINVATWDDIEGNYTSGVREQLAGMMENFEPGKGGQMLLWQGPPGTGKTWALRALASEWRQWADIHYITDPDSFFGEHADYMVEVLLRESFSYEGDEPVEKWRLLVLEDTGELLSADAKEKSGQALSRLLNVVDGLIGQGLRVLVLVTTNDQIEDFHPAVSRPGRCAVQIEFAPLDPDEASEWLGDEADAPATLAELYARGQKPAEDASLEAAAVRQAELSSASMKPKRERMKRKRQRHAAARVIVASPERGAEDVEVLVASAGQEALAVEEGLLDGEIEVADVFGDGFAQAERVTIQDAQGNPITFVREPLTQRPGAEDFEAITDSPMLDIAPPESQGNSTLAWNATLVPEGTATVDGRMFSEGSVSWRELPLTLLAQIVTAEGHDEAQVCGRIDAIWRDGSMIRASGVFDDSEYGREIARMVSEQVLRGISVDIAVQEYELVPKNAEGDEESSLVDILLGGEDMLFVVTDGVIGAVTVCSFPAFEEASISLAASGSGLIWTLQMQSGMIVTKDSTNAEIVQDPPGSVLTAAAAGLAPITPPADWFTDPELTEATPMTVEESGRVFGHIALWGTCHIGLPACTQPPESMSDYAYFHLGSIQADRGGGDDLVSIPCGKITLGTGHAGSRLGMQRAAEHYDNTGSAAADVVAGEDAYGIWVAGALRPDISAEKVRELRAATLSGDWREQDGSLELVAVLAVNVPGFPVPRPRALVAASIDDGEQVLSLTAAGVLPSSSMLSDEDRDRLNALVARAKGGEFARLRELAERARA